MSHASEDMERRKHLYTVGGIVNCKAIIENII